MEREEQYCYSVPASADTPAETKEWERLASKCVQMHIWKQQQRSRIG
jgi:hypothetical protein